MKVLLTGAAGRLGSRTWHALLANGHEVRATDCRYRADMPGQLDLVDLTDMLACYRLIEGCDAIAHLGNIPNISQSATAQELYRTNGTINMNVFQAALELRVNNIVFASSVQVISGRRHGSATDEPTVTLPYLPADGDLPVNPGNAYALSKQAGEDALRYFAALNDAGCYVGMRFPALITPESFARFASYHWGESASKPVRFTGNINEALAFLAMDDAADLVCRALERPRAGYRQYFPAARQTRPGWSVQDAIEAYYTDVPLRKPIDQLTSLVDISALTRDFDWEPTRSDEMVQQSQEEADATA
ncbi:NAD-dependent epimerase/dehydratase family protein [Phycisphaerales bacterium AB-hyl4]|uniref:NAD-dependent epimerase/dehydratase family protein n=1 Tax=Natronomicrosphaera hydrolytica TaxID=3242702 RepID=A0ABV4UAB0_9BACT